MFMPSVAYGGCIDEASCSYDTTMVVSMKLAAPGRGRYAIWLIGCCYRSVLICLVDVALNILNTVMDGPPINAISSDNIQVTTYDHA